jgi:hypothetical protein
LDSAPTPFALSLVKDIFNKQIIIIVFRPTGLPSQPLVVTGTRNPGNLAKKANVSLKSADDGKLLAGS